MKVLRAVMIASVSTLTIAGSTTAPLLDVERSETSVIVAVTPTPPRPQVQERSITVEVTVADTLPARPAQSSDSVSIDVTTTTIPPGVLVRIDG